MDKSKFDAIAEAQRAMAPKPRRPAPDFSYLDAVDRRRDELNSAILRLLDVAEAAFPVESLEVREMMKRLGYHGLVCATPGCTSRTGIFEAGHICPRCSND